MTPPVVCTVAGSDPSGGAGLQADLKTFQAFDVYGAAVVTTLTVQNACGVRGRSDVAPALVLAQLDAVRDDLPLAALKTGVLPSVAHVDALAEHLRARPVPHLVVDPVLIATSGASLAEAGVATALRTRLLPLGAIVTPNLDEAAALLGVTVADVSAMRDAARALVDCGAAAAVITGGHLDGPPRDVLCTADGAVTVLDAPRVDLPATHGTGCSLASAIAAGLASGASIDAAVATAKAWVSAALAASPPLGRGARVLDHRVRPPHDAPRSRRA